MVTGVLEETRELEYGPRRGEVICGFIRGADDRRYFVHPSDCGGRLPHRFDRVEFEPDEDGDPRGPRARQVRIVEQHDNETEPTSDLTIVCSECSCPFFWSMSEQVFYRAKRFHAPKKCARCRPIVRRRLGLE